MTDRYLLKEFADIVPEAADPPISTCMAIFAKVLTRARNSGPHVKKNERTINGAGSPGHVKLALSL